ncbi:hypothetical protein B7P43_G14602 [Cryptotermes secundus]|uniref:Reverse transcriptase domain-containing protein n=1 Tax=Cryptotermes secundus TaxID=105785 RepID=A0A2J7RBB8_9NEOP|nr:hypothetical protein B7P43_G14602 [Cryptotermes secundus]
MIWKPGKNPADVTSYRPMSLLLTISEVLEKLILNKRNKESNPQTWIPNHQFGFRRAHSTIQQSHRIANTITNALNNKQYCTAAFVDIAQAFDKVWHPGLLYKIKRIFPINYYSLLKPYLSERFFDVKINEEISHRLPIHSGVPQGSLLSPLLYTLYSHDLPTTKETTIGTFAHGTAIFATHGNPTTASSHLQDHLILTEAWLNKWKIKVNESKSTQTTFPLRKGTCPTAQINHINMQPKEQVKYLGLTSDNKLNWRQHTIKKRKQMDQKKKRTHLAHRKKIPPHHGKQVANLQSSHQAYMDIRHRTLEQRQQIQHRHYTACPVQNTPIHHERTTVCIQPHPTDRSKNSLCNGSHPRKQHQVLQQTRKSLQPTSSTNTTTS